jgi:hypothetical protein
VVRHRRVCASRRDDFVAEVKLLAARCLLLTAFYDLLKDDVPADVRDQVTVLLRKLSETMVKMPMYYMGSSVFGEANSLVFAERGRIRGLSYGSLLDEAGWVYIHPELHEIINSLGGLLVGDDSIVSGWAAFTASVSRRADGGTSISQAEVLSLLQGDSMGERDVMLAKRVLERHPQKCVWSGRATNPMHIDHMLPYTLGYCVPVWVTTSRWGFTVGFRVEATSSRRDTARRSPLAAHGLHTFRNESG